MIPVFVFLGLGVWRSGDHLSDHYDVEETTGEIIELVGVTFVTGLAAMALVYIWPEVIRKDVLRRELRPVANSVAAVMTVLLFTEVRGECPGVESDTQ